MLIILNSGANEVSTLCSLVIIYYICETINPDTLRL